MQDFREFVRELINPIVREAVKEEMAEQTAQNSTAFAPPDKETQHLELLRHKEYLNSKEVAALYGLNPKTLSNWRREGRGPSYNQDGAIIMYKRKDVEAWMKSTKKRT